ncbi:hypothetical protein ACA910_008571 [Epithemia clementina (nom. ined.)]
MRLQGLILSLLLVQRICVAFTASHRKCLGSTICYGKWTPSDGSYEIEELVPETGFGSEAVPESQRPINEYLDMTKQPLFGWASKDSIGLLVRLGIVYAVVFGAVCFPIAGATYTQDGYLIQKLAASNVGALSFIGFLMIRLYSGWGYVGSRLTSKVVEFEETGWYDGDFELKTDAERKRDKFLYDDKVKPVIDRLKGFSFGLGGLWIASIIGFNVAASYKPIYDQYDPNMLQRLSYDEKLAERASINSGGKPIYCDNRYYRAIANGGQGCDR